MKTFKIFSMAAVALCLAACSNSDDYSVQMPTQSADVLHFEAAVAAPNADATMRTVYTVDGTNITVAWKDGDKIAAIVTNSEGKYAKTDLTVSKVNTDGSATISGDITKPKDDALKVDLIYPASIVTVVNDGSDYHISFMKMSNGTLDGTLESIANNIDYRMADDCALTVSGDKATLTSAAKLESKLSIWKLTLKKEDNSSLSASKVAIGDGTGVMASATLASAASEVYLPVLVDAMSADIVISATEGSDNYYYLKKNVTLAAKKYYRSTVQMTKGAHLALLAADYEAKDGETLTGTLASNVKISIADGATVTLKDANINGGGTLPSGNYAGITCAGNATIILEGTNNKVKGFDGNYPGIYVPDGKTLTIDGTGSLDASSGVDSYNHKFGAGIGGGYQIACGNILIKGGTITATGGSDAAGIGGGQSASCGDITISSGTITATGGNGAAGIGGGRSYSDEAKSCGNILISGGTVTATGGSNAVGIGSGNKGGDGNVSCGTITITNGVTKVTATKGSGATNSIGAGLGATCGTITIGGTVYASGISTSPFEYSPIPATAHTLSASVVGDVVDTDGNAYTLDATHVLPSGVTAVAMVAYKSGSNGLAIQLNSSPEKMNWANANTYPSGLTSVPGGTWRLPSKDDWQNMFVGCAVSGDATVPDAYNQMNPMAGFKAKIAATGITWNSSVNYWSSTESGMLVWLVGVNLGDSSALAAFAQISTSIATLAVRACLAF